MLKLYDYLDSGNGYKIRLMLAHLGRPIAIMKLDIMRGQTRTPQFLAINPNGRIPVLRLDSGHYLTESDAILWYLAEGTGLSAHRPLRARPGAAMDVLRAVQPRALCCDTAFHRASPDRGQPAARRTAQASCATGAPRWPSWKRICASTITSSATATRSRTSHCMPTPTWPRTVDSSWLRTRA